MNERRVVLEEREERLPVVCREERTTARLVDAGSEKDKHAGRRPGPGGVGFVCIAYEEMEAKRTAAAAQPSEHAKPTSGWSVLQGFEDSSIAGGSHYLLADAGNDIGSI